MTTVSPELAILNLAILIEMYGDDSPATIRNVLQGFADSAPPYIMALRQAAAQSDLVALASSAHSVKSIAALIGASALASLCQQLEQAARQADSQVVLALLPLLSENWLALQQQLEQQLEHVRLNND